MAKYARIAFESPLPQLDKLFDYVVPDELTVSVGNRVRVPFGRAKKLVDGFVVELADSLSFEGTLSEIAEVVSPVKVLSPNNYALCRAIADRQAVSLGDVLKLAVPKRSVRVEQAYLESFSPASAAARVALHFAARPTSFEGKLAVLAEPRLTPVSFEGETVAQNGQFVLQGWIALFVSAALESISTGKSVLAIVPDFRDRSRLRAAFGLLGLAAAVIDYGSDQTPSQRYSAFLRATSEPARVVIGSRAALYLDQPNLGQILLWDDQDQSLEEPTSPYLHAREALLIKQQQTGANLLISSHSRSVEVERLVSIGYLREATVAFSPPAVANSDGPWRIDSAAHRLITETLASGRSALVQVAVPGQSAALYCADCSTQKRCPSCSGPLGIDAKGNVRCRWCAWQGVSINCSECHSPKSRQGRAGSTRTVAELGKVFPGVLVLEATFEKRVEELPPGKRVVVATPGAEPVVSGGYGAVVLLDGDNLLSRDSLRASEHAVNVWSNAVSLLGAGGRALLVGIGGQLAQEFTLWNQRAIAARLFAERTELGLPPAKRLASVTGAQPLVELLEDALKGHSLSGKIRLLGPSSIDQNSTRLLIEYDYRNGSELAGLLKAFVLTQASGAARSSSNGRATRALKVRMDDYEVI